MARSIPARAPLSVVCWTLSILASLAFVGGGHAREVHALDPGARVRVSSPSQGLRSSTGLVSTMDGSQLVLRLDGDSIPRALPLESIRKLELSRGRKGHLWPGLGAGLVLGAAAGGAIGAATAEGGSEWDALNVAVGIVGGAAGGLVVGGVVGALIKTERWTTVTKIGDVRLGVRVQERSTLVATVRVPF